MPAPESISGSTTIVELLRLFPGGEAAKLMSRLSWPCALTLAAKRHANSPRAVLLAFRALADGSLSEAQVDEARVKVAR